MLDLGGKSAGGRWVVSGRRAFGCRHNFAQLPVKRQLTLSLLPTPPPPAPPAANTNTCRLEIQSIQSIPFQCWFLLVCTCVYLCVPVCVCVRQWVCHCVACFMDFTDCYSAKVNTTDRIFSCSNWLDRVKVVAGVVDSGEARPGPARPGPARRRGRRLAEEYELARAQ